MNSDNFHKSLKPLAVEEFLDYYFYRRVAYRIVPFFIRLKFTPNQVTTLSLLLGLVASFLIYHQNFIGSACVAVAAIIVDCCDGQLARLTGQTSPLGRAMDGFFDLVWVAAFWVCLYTSGYFELHGFENIFPLLLLASTSTIIHCWRFDGVKIKYIEIVSPNKNEADLDVDTALALAKAKFKRLSLFEAMLAIILAFQMYFFVRGKETKPVYILPESERSACNQVLEPIISKWSYLGEGHHNTIVLIGVLFASFSPWILIGSFLVIALPMNVWWLYCEWIWMKNFRSCTRNLAILSA